MFINPTLDQEINDIIKRLKLASSGLDDIEAKLLKCVTSDIAPILYHIVNLGASKQVLSLRK